MTNSTKAQMLNILKENVKDINILPLMIIHSDDFWKNERGCIDSILSFSDNRKICVRSSSSQEDTFSFSNAGKYESILNVTAVYEDIREAVYTVIKSYNTDKNEEVLVQPMLESVSLSGVVFTRDIDTGAEYYTVNYSKGDDTAAVTAGTTDCSRTFIHYKKSPFPIKDKIMESIIDSCRRIENFLENDALDIEFAVTEGEKVFIFQVRPIAAGKKEKKDVLDISPVLNRIYKKADKLSRRHPFLLGDTTCFGVMPDWNPAEILGVRPKKLAISLYKELITDNIWARQRFDYGYRDLTMHPLMISFCGIPYIDTRITFNSFIPKELNRNIAEKLVNYYLEKLEKYPKYHDKIEFEIVFSCYYLGLHENLMDLKKHGFNENEITRIEFSLLNLTNSIINQDTGAFYKDLDKIKKLEASYNKIIDSDISLVDRIYWLIEICKEYGTLPFAGVARAGFIAVQFLKSFVETGIISQNEYDAYMGSLYTVNKQMNNDLNKLCNGELTKSEFLDEYGHIRPGTYDIMSKRYDDAFDDFFSAEANAYDHSEDNAFRFDDDRLKLIDKELEENGILVSAKDLLNFIKASIEGRESLKFAFTKLVSKILQLVEEIGLRFNIDKSDMAYIDISVIKQLYVDLYTGDTGDLFRDNIRRNKLQYDNAVVIKLPSLIAHPEDVYSFYQLDEEPNYITQKSVTAETRILDDNNDDIEGKIVFIQSADPGYDFIFSKNIGGLVTQFGGANSHMAIRCAELGIPAVIGVGESRYKEWSEWKKAEIDCILKQVIRIE